MNREGLKQLIRESFQSLREGTRDNSHHHHDEDTGHDPIAKWKDFCSLCADPGNRDFKTQVGRALTEDSEILISVLEALEDESHVELHNEIYKKLRRNV